MLRAPVWSPEAAQRRATVGCPYCEHGELSLDADDKHLQFTGQSGKPCCHLIYVEWSSYDGANDNLRKGSKHGDFISDLLRDMASDYLSDLLHDAARPFPQSLFELKTDWHDSTYCDAAFAIDGELGERSATAEIRAIFAENPTEFIDEVSRYS
jgi:hypothetical protein